MNWLVESCIAEIKGKSRKKGATEFDGQVPKQPSIIVNYNLEEDTIKSYCDYLKQLWPTVYINIPQTNPDSNFEEIEKQVRSNDVFSIINEIQVHILVNMTKCDLNKLNGFITEKFNDWTYRLLLHEFLDYGTKAEIEKTERNLIDSMRNRDRIRFRFVYSNKLANGAMWLDENASKILKLAADITAITSIDPGHFNDGNTYTFSYNLLEKPTKKIVRFTIRRLLEKVCSCPENEELDTDISKKFSSTIKKAVAHRIHPFRFTKNDFKYLPDNRELQRERAKTKKGVYTLERTHPVSAACFHAMIDQRERDIEKANIINIDFSNELNDNLLTYYSVEGFLQGNQQKRNELLNALNNSLFSDRSVPDEGTYADVLTEHANQDVDRALTRRVYAVFADQFRHRIDHAAAVHTWLLDYLNSPELQVGIYQNDLDLMKYYNQLVDDYFSRHTEKIIKDLDKCNSKEDILKQGLFSILCQMFDSIPIYYKPFEEEIDERTGNDTARKMFEEISNENSVRQNMCIDWTNLQFHLNRETTGIVLLLINPRSKLLNPGIIDSYRSMRLNRQDCVERIDLHTLSLKTEDGE